MNQMKKIIAALFLATLLLSACKSSKEASSNSNEFIKESTKEVTTVEKWIVAGEKVNCPETSTELCYQIKKFGSSDYESMNVDIQGFNYEPGYKNQIEVKVLPSKKEATQYIFIKEMVKIASSN